MSYWLPKVFVALWFIGATTAAAYMLWYESKPGDRVAAASRWPEGSSLEPAHDRPTLLMFLHPACPCSRASLSELGHVAAHSSNLLSMTIVLTGPAARQGSDEGWTNWQLANELPGVAICIDESGEEARRFHVTTSGETLLYSAAGELLFQGGITWARGHEGENLGRSAVIDLIRGEAGPSQTAVFGCPLNDQQPSGVRSNHDAMGSSRQP